MSVLAKCVYIVVDICRHVLWFHVSHESQQMASSSQVTGSAHTPQGYKVSVIVGGPGLSSMSHAKRAKAKNRGDLDFDDTRIHIMSRVSVNFMVKLWLMGVLTMLGQAVTL